MSDVSGLVRTGIAGLDEIFLGGIRRNNNILVEGPPGAGKTTLGLQFVYAGAKHLDEPGAILSFELDSTKLLRDARGFDWDLEGCLEDGTVRIIETTPAALLEDLRLTDGVLAEELAELGARRLLLDGLTPLQLHCDAHDIPFRESIHLLIESLTRLEVTSLVTREEEPAPGIAHERYVFDTIIGLRQRYRRRQVLRSLCVTKSRGQDFVGGPHSVRIAPGRGVEVYRRVQSRPKAREDQPTSTERVSTGCQGLDEIMSGGLYRGSVTLVAGIAGTGKTVAATQFLMQGVAEGRKGLLVSLDEHPRQLCRNAESLGFDLEGAIARGEVFLHYESPLELELDVHFDRMAKQVEREGIELIVCDSVAMYQRAAADETIDFLYALATYFKQRLCTLYLNYESPELLGVSQIGEELRGSHIVDNVVMLNYVEVSTRLRRALSVPKTRGTDNLRVTREFTIGEGGIRVLVPEDDPQAVPQLPFSSYSGLLARSPPRRPPRGHEADRGRETEDRSEG